MALILHPIEPLAAAATGIVLALALSLGGQRPAIERPLPSPVPDLAIPAPHQHRIRQGIPIEVLRVIDGDTVKVRAQISLDQHVITRVRIRAIDAPERQSRCEEEKRRAEASRDQLIGLLGQGPTYLTDLGRDKYGSRVLGRLMTADGLDIGEKMIRSGHARSYSGGKRSGWC